jgi:hypothetical protein
LSLVKSRGFHVFNDHRPSSSARRVMPDAVTALNISGKSVTTPNRIAVPAFTQSPTLAQ